MSTNQKIADEVIRHAVYAQRYGGALGVQISRLLDEVDDDLTDIIASRAARIAISGDTGPKTTQRLTELLDVLRPVNANVYKKVHSTLVSELGDFAGFAVEDGARAINKHVDFAASLPSPAKLKALVETSPVDGFLLKSWTEHLGDVRLGNLERTLRNGITEGQTIDQLVTRIRGTKANNYTDGILELSRTSAKTLAITASGTVSNRARLDMYRENSRVIKGIQWLSTLDGRPCSVCQSRDRKFYLLDEPHPVPPIHPRCRCTLIPVTKSWEELGQIGKEMSPGTRASMDGQVAGDMSYGPWLKRQSAEVQEIALGSKARAKLYRDGDVTFEQMYKPDGQFWSLTELKQRSGAAERSKPSTPTPAAPPVAPKAPAKPKFTSPINPTVRDETVEVRPRLKIQKELSEKLALAGKDRRYSPLPEFKGVTAAHFGKASFPTDFTDECVSMLAALAPELDEMATAFSIPPLRGYRQTKAATANMGDGILGLNPNTFNAYAARIGGSSDEKLALKLEKERDEIRAKLDDTKKRLTDLRTEMTALRTGTGVSDEIRYRELYGQERLLIKEYNALIRPLKKVSGQLSTATRTSMKPVSAWKVGDDPKTRPHGVTDYFSGIDKARAVLYHEFGHHVHQMYKKDGPRSKVNKPPVERELEGIFIRKFVGLSDEHKANVAKHVSNYAKTNSKEWFAENFAAYMMGRLDLVDVHVKEIIERLLNE